MLINSREFGKITIDSKQLLEFPHGIYGFEHCNQWALVDTPKKPFYVMQSLTDVHISFILINPYLVYEDYILDIPEGDVDVVEHPDANDLLVFTIVTIRQDPHMVTANLAGPILINRDSRLGVQAVQQNTNWDTRFPIVAKKKAAV